MRNTFINTLTELAKTDESIFLVCGDLGYSVLEPFRDAFPERFLNAGIAEQNMIGLATGLSREGFNVFVYSIGNFPTLRAMEQIRYDVCYHDASVKIVAVGAGYAYGPLGTSHHTTEDLAMMRVLPNMIVMAPGDSFEGAAAARWLAAHRGPGYVRINKSGEAPVHGGPVTLSKSCALEIKPGRTGAVLCAGAILDMAQRNELVSSGEYGLYSFPFVKPLDTSLLERLCEKYERLITFEEHQLAGGFGSAIVEALSDMYSVGRITHMPRVTRHGIHDSFTGFAGSQDYLRGLAVKPVI